MKRAIRIDDELWARVVAAAERSSRRPEDVVEDAVLRYLDVPADVLDRLRPAADLSDAEATELAVREVRAHRSEGQVEC